MNKDLISVIVIVYNTSLYLKDCLESIINQTYKHIEIIVVNDGSTDNSSTIINKYVKKDKRIKFIDRKENKGTIYTRKEGFDNSKGKYVTFVDSDDMLELNALELMHNELVNNKCDIVKSNFSIYKNGVLLKNSETLNRKMYTKKDFEPEFYDLLYKTIHLNTMCGLLIDRKCLKVINKVDLTLIYGEDLSSNLYMYMNTNRLLVIKDQLYAYRQNDNSISFTYDKNKLIKKIYDSIKTYLLVKDFIDVYKIKNKNKYIDYTRQKLKKYIAMFLLKYCYSQTYKEFKELTMNIFNDRKLLFLFDESNNNIDMNKFTKTSINLLFKKKYLLFYIYSKYIYKNIQKIYYLIKK